MLKPHSRTQEDRYREGLELDPTFCWQAVYSRDRRFDGRFFAGIETTGTYCRSTCPVSFGHPQAVRWFQTAAGAESSGFRPCRRCHPDTSPGSAAWFGTWAVVSRGLKLISEGALGSGNLEQLSDRLGIGSRHLRRLFHQHLGTSPLKIARAHRVHVAKGLIVGTQMPIRQIALGTGFRSIRQFNHSVRAAFGQSPSELRRLHGNAAKSDPVSGITLHLPYRPPFEWEALLHFLVRRAIPGVESVENGVYRRSVEVGGVAGAIEVSHERNQGRLSMRVLLPGCGNLMQVVQRARRLFDLGADTLHIGACLCRNRRLAKLVAERPGLRVPGAWDGFEIAVLSVLGQSLTEAGQAGATARLMSAFGRAVALPVPEITHLFPRPEELAGASLEKIGISPAQADTIRALAGAALEGDLNLDSPKEAQSAVRKLQSVPGLSEAAISYIGARALGDPDAFSGAEPGLRAALSAFGSASSPEGARRLMEKYRPWRAYAAVHYCHAAQQNAGRGPRLRKAMSNSAESIRRHSRVSRLFRPRS